MFALFLFYFFVPDTSVDFELWDTFNVISLKGIYWLLIIGNLLVWFLYFLFHKRMSSKILTWIHISSTIGLNALILQSIFLGSYLFYPKGYYQFCDTTLSSKSENNEDMGVLISVMLFIQLFFVINCGGRFLKKTILIAI